MFKLNTDIVIFGIKLRFELVVLALIIGGVIIVFLIRKS